MSPISYTSHRNASGFVPDDSPSRMRINLAALIIFAILVGMVAPASVAVAENIPTATPARTPTPASHAQAALPEPIPMGRLTPNTSGLKSPSSTPTATPAPSSPYLWALIGNDLSHLADVNAAGIKAKVFELTWRELVPSENNVNTDVVRQRKNEMAQIRQAGFQIILDLGFTDAPSWVHTNYPNTYYVNQYGDRYDGQGQLNSGDVNLIFNSNLRVLVQSYLNTVFTNFGTDFAAVRLGGGHWGELTYPSHTYNGRTNAYWAFDANALTASPVPTWRPGQPSPNGAAATFLNWYLDSLASYQNWQISALRQTYSGKIMMLYPSWGVRPGHLTPAIAGNLAGATSPEINGEIQRGSDFARQLTAITDAKVVVTTTWLDASSSHNSSGNPADWSPVKYLAYLATTHPLRLSLYGENAGNNSAATMRFAVSQVQQYGLMGMDWCRESDIFSGQYATLTDLQQSIATVTSP